MRRSVFLTAVSFLVLILALPVQGDDPKALEKWLEDNFEGKIATVRHFYSGSRLRYDASGKLEKGGKPGPWTLTGKVLIRDVEVSRDRVEIRGSRVYMWYDEKERKLKNVTSSETLEIEIRLSGDQATRENVREALQQIFVTPADKLEDVVPEYWRRHVCRDRPEPCPPIKEEETPDPAARARLLERLPLPDPGTEHGGVYRIGGDVTPPQCRSCPDPKYPDAARHARLEGVVVLLAVVNEKGRAEKIKIAKPLGLGLDDAAVDALREWKFEPARRDGRPVPVYMTIEMNFHLFK